MSNGLLATREDNWYSFNDKLEWNAYDVTMCCLSIFDSIRLDGVVI